MKNLHIIFDIDGTLTKAHDIDFNLYFDSVREILKIKSFSTDLSNYSEITDSGIAHSIAEKYLNRSLSKLEIQKIEDLFSLKLSKELGISINYEEMEGAIEFVKYVESQDIKISVATGNWRKTALLKLKSLGLSRLIKNASTSSEEISRIDILRRAINLDKKIGHQQTWYIGDGFWDVECSSTLGINFLGVGDKLKDSKLPYWVPDLQNKESTFALINKIASYEKNFI